MVRTQVARNYLKRKTGLGKPKKGGKLLSKENVSIVLDHALPFASSTLYHYYDMNGPASATTGRIIGHIARKGIKSLTGLGKKHQVGVGVYELDKPMKKVKSPMKKNNRRAIRGQVLKLLMKSGISFIEASKNVSKYINDHKL